MMDQAMLAGVMELCLLPLVGVGLLVTSKVTTGRASAFAASLFLVALLLAGFATFRTMLAGETIWWIHALTVAILVVGAASVPANASTSLHAAPRL